MRRRGTREETGPSGPIMPLRLAVFPPHPPDQEHRLAGHGYDRAVNFWVTEVIQASRRHHGISGSRELARTRAEMNGATP